MVINARNQIKNLLGIYLIRISTRRNSVNARILLEKSIVKYRHCMLTI